MQEGRNGGTTAAMGGGEDGLQQPSRLCAHQQAGSESVMRRLQDEGGRRFSAETSHVQACSEALGSGVCFPTAPTPLPE